MSLNECLLPTQVVYLFISPSDSKMEVESIPVPDEEVKSKPDTEVKTEENKEDKKAENAKKKSAELEKYWKPVKSNPGDFTGWTYLLQYVEQEVQGDPISFQIKLKNFSNMTN